MFLNQTEINTIKQKVKSGQQPWTFAYNSLMSKANNALNIDSAGFSVTYGGNISPCGDNHDFWIDSGYSAIDTYDRDALKQMAFAVRHLGLAYALDISGNESIRNRYANKAILLIKIWAINSNTKMNPWFTSCHGESERNRQLRVSIVQNIPSMFYGASMIWNYVGWNLLDREKFRSWIISMINSGKKWCSCNNFEDSRIIFLGTAASLIGDTITLNYVFNRWKSMLNGGSICGINVSNTHITNKGEMRYEIYAGYCTPARPNALHYSTHALSQYTLVAEIARHYGVNLYQYKNIYGIGIEKAFDFYANYLKTYNPRQMWINTGYSQEWSYKRDSDSIYEIAYARYKKQLYKDVLNKNTRPMTEYFVLGPITLTHGI